VRVDNDPEYISVRLMEWAEKRTITIAHIRPGKPRQNADIERHNRTARHAWWGCFTFETIRECRITPHAGSGQTSTTDPVGHRRHIAEIETENGSVMRPV
jgi:transposase InsO family protein